MQFQFAHYTFDENVGLIFDSQPVHLPPKERGILQVLLEARGQVVCKDDLIFRVWGSNEASDESISRAVYRLRVAMQSSGGPEVVETVYNAGFRVTVPIRVGNLGESSSLAAMTRSMLPNAVAALISAREFLARRTAPDVEASATAARMAISLDPAFSAAWTMLAEIRVFQATRCLRPPREAGWMAKEAARAALELEPQSAPALSIRGWVRVMIDHDGPGGLSDLDNALALDPDYWAANLLRGWAMQACGQQEEAVEMMRRALELNAVGHSVNAILALFLLFAGQHEEALQVALELAKRFPTIDNAQGIASIVCSVHKHHEAAIEFGHRAVLLAPHTPLMQAPLAAALAAAGRHTEARRVLAAIEASRLPPPSASLTAVYLALGERDRAIASLLDACERGIPQFAWTRDDHRLSALRGDPAVEHAWAGIWCHT